MTKRFLLRLDPIWTRQQGSVSEVLGFIYCKRKRWRAKRRRVAGEADCAICFNSRDPSAVLTSLRTAIKWSLHSAQISPLFINFRNCFIVFCVNDEHVIFRPIYAPRLSPKQNELSNFVCTKKNDRMQKRNDKIKIFNLCVVSRNVEVLWGANDGQQDNDAQSKHLQIYIFFFFLLIMALKYCIFSSFFRLQRIASSYITFYTTNNLFQKKKTNRKSSDCAMTWAITIANKRNSLSCLISQLFSLRFGTVAQPPQSSTLCKISTFFISSAVIALSPAKKNSF